MPQAAPIDVARAALPQVLMTPPQVLMTLPQMLMALLLAVALVVLGSPSARAETLTVGPAGQPAYDWVYYWNVSLR